MNKAQQLAEKLKQYIPNGDGYNSEFANDLAEAVEYLSQDEQEPVAWLITHHENPPVLNLGGANLEYEMLLITPISITNLTWPILITHGYMYIGCQRHTHEEWKSFDEESIKKMHGRANKFWAVWKKPLLAMCAKHYEEAMKVKGD